MNRGEIGIGIGIGIVNSPATTTHVGNSSGWLFEGTKWTAEENKVFESALALFDKDTPDRWYNVAAMIPGKTVNDVIKQYRELEEDVCDIEAGLIPVPGYNNNNNNSSRRRNSSFTLEWEGGSNLYNHGGKRQTSSRTFEQERKKGVPWTEEEHRLFLMGLKKYGKGDWRTISRNFVTSRTPTQVASHAQKYFIRQLSGEGGNGNGNGSGKEMKRRSSIHDITTAHLNLLHNNGKSSPENNSPCSTSHSNLTTATAATTTTATTTKTVSKATSKYWNNMDQGLGSTAFNSNHQLLYDFPNAFC